MVHAWVLCGRIKILKEKYFPLYYVKLEDHHETIIIIRAVPWQREFNGEDIQRILSWQFFFIWPVTVDDMRCCNIIRVL